MSIRRIIHKGQSIPENKEIIKSQFIEAIINKRKELDILEVEDYRVLNKDETPCLFEMGLDTTIDFKGKKEIEIETSGRDHYRITLILTVAADGTKLPPIVIVKGEEGEIIENHLRKLDVKNNNLLVYCQRRGWCTNLFFIEWIKLVLLSYQRSIQEKCLVVLDKASSHISNDSIGVLNENGVNYILIPVGMTSICQPLDIAVNKIFKDNIRLLFEKERLI